MNSVTTFALTRTRSSLSPSQFRNPLSQFLQVSHIHAGDKFLPMNVVHRQDVILMKEDLAALLQVVQSTFNQRIVYGASKITSRPLFHSNPKVLAPTTGRNLLLWQRNERCRMAV